MTTSRIIRTSQPQGAVGIDWSNPLAKGLVFVWSGATPYRNLIGQELGIKTGTLQSIASGIGQSPYFASSNIAFTTELLDRLVGDVTVCSYFLPKADGYPTLINALNANGASASPFSLGTHTGNTLFGRASANGWRSYRSNLQCLIGTLNVSAVAHSGDIEIAPKMYLNGIKASIVAYASGTGTGPATHNNRPIRIGDADSGGQAYTGYIGLNLVWTRALNDQELVELSSNPYQIFTPIKTPIFVGTAAASVQLLSTLGRPVADIAMGAWAPSAGTTLFGCIDEVVPEDSDYIYTNTASTCEIALDATAYPGGAIQTIAYRASSEQGSTLVVRVIQNSLVLASWTHTLTAIDTLYTQVLTTEQINSLASGAISIQLETI